MSFVNWQFSAQQVYAWYIWCIHVHGLAILDKGGGGLHKDDLEIVLDDTLWIMIP